MRHNSREQLAFRRSEQMINDVSQDKLTDSVSARTSIDSTWSQYSFKQEKHPRTGMRHNSREQLMNGAAKEKLAFRWSEQRMNDVSQDKLTDSVSARTSIDSTWSQYSSKEEKHPRTGMRHNSREQLAFRRVSEQMMNDVLQDKLTDSVSARTSIDSAWSQYSSKEEKHPRTGMRHNSREQLAFRRVSEQMMNDVLQDKLTDSVSARTSIDSAWSQYSSKEEKHPRTGMRHNSREQLAFRRVSEQMMNDVSQDKLTDSVSARTSIDSAWSQYSSKEEKKLAVRLSGLQPKVAMLAEKPCSNKLKDVSCWSHDTLECASKRLATPEPAAVETPQCQPERASDRLATPELAVMETPQGQPCDNKLVRCV